ncbi:MAG: NIPSNAP family protein [Balneolales bacterium]
MKHIDFYACLIAAIFTLNFTILEKEATGIGQTAECNSSSEGRIYEMRTYTTHPGKLDDLHERFINHTIPIFGKYGMVSVGYWVPEEKDNTLVYILSHNCKEAAEKSWADFRSDPDWQQAYQASRTDGPLVRNVESVFMKATSYSQIR